MRACVAQLFLKLVQLALPGGRHRSVRRYPLDLIQRAEQELRQFLALLGDHGCPAAGFFQQAISLVPQPLGLDLEPRQLCRWALLLLAALALLGVEPLAGGTQLQELRLRTLELGQQRGAVRFAPLRIFSLPVAERDLVSSQLLLKLPDVRVKGCPLMPNRFEAVGDLCQQPVDLVAIVTVEAPADRKMPYLFWRDSRRISLLKRSAASDTKYA